MYPTMAILLRTFEPFADPQTPISQLPQPMPPLPPVTTRKEEIEVIVDDQSVSTRRGGYQRYLVKWKGQPDIDRTWLIESELQQLDPNILE